MTDNKNCKSLIIRNLDPKVTEESLKGIFALISPVTSVKIINDDNNGDLNCGFVEFHEHRAAEQALHTMDKRVIYNQEIAIDWNHVEQNDGLVDDATSVQIFVTNLDSSVNDEILANAFAPFHMSGARVINDGEGVVTFTDKSHAEDAINQMDGQTVGASKIRCDWSLVEPSDSISSASSSNHSRRSSTDSDGVVVSNISYEEIFAQTPLYNTSVYIANLPKEVIKQDIAPHLQQYGFVSDIYIKGSKATVKLDTHANAATAIFALQGMNIAGNNVRLGWVKDRAPERIDSQDNMQRSFNVFSSGYEAPKKLVKSIMKTYDNNHKTMRPPAPTSDPEATGGEPGGGLHGWNQYYQQYYSAGHITI